MLVFMLPDWSWWPRVWRTATSTRAGSWTTARRSVGPARIAGRRTGKPVFNPGTNNRHYRNCEPGLGQPLQRLACRLAPGVPGDHVTVLPPPLVLNHCGRRSRGHHLARHADPAAVSGKVFAQAGGPGRSSHPLASVAPVWPGPRPSG